MKLLSLCVICALFTACNAPKPGVLNAGNLESFYVTVNIDKDTLIKTPKGAIIKILNHSFSENVELEIKEAYTMKDIVLAGLNTESNGKPLRSGGMIYINSRNGKEISVQKPIKILLPANGIEEGMEVFKGSVTDDNINWQPVDSLIPSINEEMLKVGRSVFISNCYTCHSIKTSKTAPALKGFTSRGPWTEISNIFKWIKSPSKFIPTTRYTIELQKEWGSVMPSFPQLSDEDINSVISFINNEAQKSITDTFSYAQPGVASDTATDAFKSNPCMDTIYSYQRNDPVLDLATAQNFLNSEEDSITKNEVWEGFRGGFNDLAGSGGYLFEIQTMGWYNVDVFAEGIPGTELVELNGSLSGKDKNHGLIIYAFFPQQKNLSVGAMEDGTHFSFKKIGNQIPLFKGEPGILLAFGADNEKFYYGISYFKVKEKQNVEIKLKPSTREALIDLVKNEKIEGINLDVTEAQIKIVDCNTDSQ